MADSIRAPREISLTGAGRGAWVELARCHLKKDARALTIFSARKIGAARASGAEEVRVQPAQGVQPGPCLVELAQADVVEAERHMAHRAAWHLAQRGERPFDAALVVARQEPDQAQNDEGVVARVVARAESQGVGQVFDALRRVATARLGPAEALHDVLIVWIELVRAADRGQAGLVVLRDIEHHAFPQVTEVVRAVQRYGAAGGIEAFFP